MQRNIKKVFNQKGKKKVICLIKDKCNKNIKDVSKNLIHPLKNHWHYLPRPRCQDKRMTIYKIDQNYDPMDLHNKQRYTKNIFRTSNRLVKLINFFNDTQMFTNLQTYESLPNIRQDNQGRTVDKQRLEKHRDDTQESSIYYGTIENTDVINRALVKGPKVFYYRNLQKVTFFFTILFTGLNSRLVSRKWNPIS